MMTRHFSLCIAVCAASLFAAPAQAKEVEEASTPPVQDSLAFCGGQVTALAWFYKGLVEEGQSTAQSDLDTLLYLRTEMRAEAIRRGAEHLEQLDARSEEQIDGLTQRIADSEDAGALALAELNTDVRSCVNLLFEKVE